MTLTSEEYDALYAETGRICAEYGAESPEASLAWARLTEAARLRRNHYASIGRNTFGPELWAGGEA